LLQISRISDQESDVAKSQRAALEELIQRMCELESDSSRDLSQNMKSNRPGDENLPNMELDVTKEQLRLSEEEVLSLRSQLDQSKETVQEMGTLTRVLEYELDLCRTALQETQDARRAGRIKFIEAVGLLRLRRAELESLMAEAEGSQFRCSQVMFLSAALQERVTDLEAQVETLKSAQKRATTLPAYSGSHSFCPSNTGMCAPSYPLSCTLSLRASSDLEASTRSTDLQTSDSIYMTVPSSLPCLLNLSLPHSSLQSSDISPYISDETWSAPPPAYIDSCSPFHADTGILALRLCGFVR
jgi:hypothetical protein